MLKLTAVAVVVALLVPLPSRAQSPAPGAVADELLAADTAFSNASAATGVIAALSAMFSDDVVLLAAGRRLDGKAAAVDALKANPDNLKTHLRWMPKRVGVSADGQHGFTAGFMLAERDGKAEPLKYLAYWVKGAAGWRVAVYKRVRAAGESPVSLESMAPALPAKIVPATTDVTAQAAHRESLAEAERSFSKDAQTMGLGPAFAKYGSSDAINLGGANVAGFVVGNTAIGDYVGKGSPQSRSPVSWGPDRVIVASSGDLGVTIGLIRRNTVEPGGPQSTPFFTIWHRASATAPWKYIAE